jgi:hypothetical protein
LLVTSRICNGHYIQKRTAKHQQSGCILNLKNNAQIELPHTNAASQQQQQQLVHTNLYVAGGAGAKVERNESSITVEEETTSQK